MPGRNPYPYAMKNATNDTGHLTKAELEKRRKSEPTIKSSELKCPTHLSDEAKKEWRRIVKLYKELSVPVLCDLDSHVLEVYCNAVVDYRHATKKVQETAAVYLEKGSRKPRKNVWQVVANEAAEQMRKYGDLLLLNPISRARMGTATNNENRVKDPMELYMEKRAQRNNSNR